MNLNDSLILKMLPVKSVLIEDEIDWTIEECSDILSHSLFYPYFLFLNIPNGIKMFALLIYVWYDFFDWIFAVQNVINLF